MGIRIKKGHVSAILPVKNSALTLIKTIQSIKLQVYSDWELIIVVAPSEDESLSIAKTEAKFDQRIKVVFDIDSKGIAEACNVALSYCAGEFIAICNADDINMPNRFLAQKNYMSRHPEVGVLGSNVQTFGKVYTYWNMPREHNLIAPTMLFRGAIANPTAMVRHQTLKVYNIKYNPFFNRGSEDLELWERMSCVTKIQNLNYALIKYRVSNTQLSAVTAASSLKNAREVRERIHSRLGLSNIESYSAINNKIADNEIGIDIEEANEWFEKLISANSRVKHFDSVGLSRVIEKEKFLILERNLQNPNSRHVNSSIVITKIISKFPLPWKLRAMEILRRNS